jgi:D-methionine transport system ATP-binding protein
VIELRNIGKNYYVKERSIPALRGINLSIKAGEIFGVIGHSGAGKSTLIRLINLLERPTEGSINVEDFDLLKLSAPDLRKFRQRVGMIFQHFNLLGSKTVAENIAFPLKIIGQLSSIEIYKRVDEMLELVELSIHKHKYPKQLSGGEKQRVGIARALASRPHVLLCDEATSALDPQTTRSILQLLRQINEKLKLTIVLITHEMDVIRTICDRVAVIDKGEIVECGPVLEVFLHPKHPTTRNFLQEENIQLLLSDEALKFKKQVRLTMSGQSTMNPILSRLARDFNIDFAIVNGRFGKLKSTLAGNLSLLLYGDEVKISDALVKLREEGVTVEDISHA